MLSSQWSRRPVQPPVGKSHRGLLSRGGDGAVRGRGARPKYWQQIRSRREEWKTVILLVYFYFCVYVCVWRKIIHFFLVDTLGPSFFSLEWLILSAMLESSLGRVFAGSTWVLRAAVPTSIGYRRSCLWIGHRTRTTRDQGNQGPRPFLLAHDLGLALSPYFHLFLTLRTFGTQWNHHVKVKMNWRGREVKPGLLQPLSWHRWAVILVSGRYVCSLCLLSLMSYSIAMLSQRGVVPPFSTWPSGEREGVYNPLHNRKDKFEELESFAMLVEWILAWPSSPSSLGVPIMGKNMEFPKFSSWDNIGFSKSQYILV